jgi:hypothetical protein
MSETTDRENLRRLTLLLDALEQERQDEAGRRKEYAARIEILTTELLKLRGDIKNGQGTLFSSADQGKSPAAGRAAAAETADNSLQGTPPLPSHNRITEALDDARPDEANA